MVVSGQPSSSFDSAESLGSMCTSHGNCFLCPSQPPIRDSAAWIRFIESQTDSGVPTIFNGNLGIALGGGVYCIIDFMILGIFVYVRQPSRHPCELLRIYLSHMDLNLLHDAESEQFFLERDAKDETRTRSTPKHLLIPGPSIQLPCPLRL